MTENTDHSDVAGIVVFDTSVLIPMAIPASRSTRLFSRLKGADWRVAASPQILHEVEDKLRTKRELRRWLGISDEEVEQFIVKLATLCRFVKGIAQAHGAVPADPDDDMIVAAAIEVRAGYIVTEDKHLLDLKEYEGIKILNREQFEQELDRLGVPKGEPA